LTARKADATTNGKPAMGYVLAAVANAAPAQVYLDSLNSQVTGKTPGQTQYLSIVPGATSPTAPVANGNLVQVVGFAISPTIIKLSFDEVCTVVV
jgi:hypothetical protein